MDGKKSRKRSMRTGKTSSEKPSRMKMIFRILLLINLISCVSGTFVMNVTKTSYQAEENHNITLEWTFSTKPDMSITSVNTLCSLFINHKPFVLLHLHDGVEVSESQHQQFSGRVQFDKDVLREGRIRLELSRLRTEDSGLYLCDVKTNDGFGSETCRLNVIAVDQPEPQRPTASPEPESQGRIGLYVGLGLTAAAVLLVTLCFALRRCFTKSTDNTGNPSSVV
ncbi:CD276 antigen-like isoform X3 [Channa argus]|uniref:CD276 antigen-like isoform X3 n=1 Tax=Channa argus TaxID=215402 RepID=UPI003521B9E6